MPNQFWPPPIVIDLLRFVGGLSNRKVRLLKSGLPGKRDMHALNQNLLQSRDLSEVRSFEDSGYLLFLYELGYQLDLFTEQQGQLVPRIAHTHAWAQRSPFEQQTDVFDAYCRMVLWNESNEWGALQLYDVEEPSQTTQLSISSVLRARKALLAQLPDLLQDTPTVEECLNRCKTYNDDWLRLAPEGEGSYEGILRHTEEGIQTLHYPDDWHDVDGFFLHQLFQTSLQWLGCITSYTDFNGVEHYTLAETWLNSAELPDHMQHPSYCVVEANLDVLLFPGANQAALLLQLERFCIPLDGERIVRYHIDKKRFFNALQTGYSFQHVHHFLEQNSRTPVPTNVLQLVQNWFQQSNQIVISKQGAIIEASTESELADKLKHWPETIPYTLLNATTLFVPSYAHAELRAWLHTQGPTQEIDYKRTLPKSLHIHSSLQVEIIPPVDLLAETVLNKIAEPLECSGRGQRVQFQITRETLERAFQDGWTYEQILRELELRTKVFSSTDRLRLESFAKSIGHVFAGEIFVVMTEDSDVLDRLEHEGGLGTYLHRLGATTAWVAAEHKERVRELLQTYSLPTTDCPRDILFPAPADEEEQE